MFSACNSLSWLEWQTVSGASTWPFYHNSFYSAGQAQMWDFFQLLSIFNPIKHSKAMKIITVWGGRLGIYQMDLDQHSIYHLVFTHPLHGYSGCYVSPNPHPTALEIAGWFPFCSVGPFGERLGSWYHAFFLRFCMIFCKRISVSLSHSILDLETGSDLKIRWGIIIFHLAANFSIPVICSWSVLII